MIVSHCIVWTGASTDSSWGVLFNLNLYLYLSIGSHVFFYSGRFCELAFPWSHPDMAFRETREPQHLITPGGKWLFFRLPDSETKFSKWRHRAEYSLWDSRRSEVGQVTRLRRCVRHGSVKKLIKIIKPGGTCWLGLVFDPWFPLSLRRMLKAWSCGSPFIAAYFVPFKRRKSLKCFRTYKLANKVPKHDYQFHLGTSLV